MKKNWYTHTRPDDLQGLIIEEETGRNVAVSYDPKDAPILAAAPKMLKACESAQSIIYTAVLDTREAKMTFVSERLMVALRLIDAAIAEAKGE